MPCSSTYFFKVHLTFDRVDQFNFNTKQWLVSKVRCDALLQLVAMHVLTVLVGWEWIGVIGDCMFNASTTYAKAEIYPIKGNTHI